MRPARPQEGEGPWRSKRLPRWHPPGLGNCGSWAVTALTPASGPGLQAVLAVWAAGEPEEDGQKPEQDSSPLRFTVLIVVWWAVKFYCQTSLLGFYQLVSALTLTFMTWQRGCPSVPWPHSFLAVGMLASRQSQTFRSLWIPLTSVTPMILLQASYGDSPGSCNQNFPGDQITLESSLVPGSQEEPGFSYPHSCCLAWTLAWVCQGGGAPTDASRNNDAVTLWWAPPETSGLFRGFPLYMHQSWLVDTQTLWGRPTLMNASSTTQPSSCTKRKLGFFFSSFTLV